METQTTCVQLVCELSQRHLEMHLSGWLLKIGEDDHLVVLTDCQSLISRLQLGSVKGHFGCSTKYCLHRGS